MKESLIRITAIFFAVVLCSCNHLDGLKEGDKFDTKIMVSDISDSNWDVIFIASHSEILCTNYLYPYKYEVLYLMDENIEVRMIFDDSNTIQAFHYKDADYVLQYNEDSLSDLSEIDSFNGFLGSFREKIKNECKVSGVLENYDRFSDFLKSVNDTKWNKTKYGAIDDQLVAIVDSVKGKPNCKPYYGSGYHIVNLQTGTASVDGNDVYIELLGSIYLSSSSLEYGICYSLKNNNPSYSDYIVDEYAISECVPLNIDLPCVFHAKDLPKGKYYYRGFAKCDERVIYGDTVGEFEVESDGRWVDLGLDVFWADRNLGAESPTEYGEYYAWGELEPKESYSWINYEHGQNVDSGYMGNYWLVRPLYDIAGVFRYDAAYTMWGDYSRLPYAIEFEQLQELCVWEMVDEGGISGVRITGVNGNSIFLPNAGNIDETYPLKCGESGYYWTGSYFSIGVSAGAKMCVIDGVDNISICGTSSCYLGQSIRPVKDIR